LLHAVWHQYATESQGHCHKSGTDFIGRPAGWRKDQITQRDEAEYHQPSDELDDSWEFKAARLRAIAEVSE